MNRGHLDSFESQHTMTAGGREYQFVSLERFAHNTGVELDSLPHSWKIIIENLLRHEDGFFVTKDIVLKVVNAFNCGDEVCEVPFFPARVLLQDFTGVPALVDLAAMRDVMAEWGLDSSFINPRIPVNLVIDHSLQVDVWASKDAADINLKKEFERNEERYCFLKWGQGSFSHFSVVPPGKGIIHQINLEHLSTVVQMASLGDSALLFPDTVVGTDSHTTMINGLGVLGWGVGGIEAEAVILGLPYYFPIPEVVGVTLVGSLPECATATDIALLVTEELRKVGVVGKFVEFFGPAWRKMKLLDRATIANMAPEYGATVGFCPVDDKTIQFLKQTGRRNVSPDIVVAYLREQHLLGDYSRPEMVAFSNIVEIDVSKAVPSVAGPKRPQDRIPIDQLPQTFPNILARPKEQWGYGLSEQDQATSVEVNTHKGRVSLRHGSIVLAAITSCTNTANPTLIVTAALVARKARSLGIEPKPWVKTSFTPGSQSVTSYLNRLELLDDLEALGFHICGYGCATCIGNSGHLYTQVENAIRTGSLVACAVISANRNFEGRVHSLIRANFLASPPLVVAYALAGNIDIDWENKPIGISQHSGMPVYLRDLWPDAEEVERMLNSVFDSELFERTRRELFQGSKLWQALRTIPSRQFPWDEKSTYLRRPLYLRDISRDVVPVSNIGNARVLLYLGDSITTDHISPAGPIPEDSPAGRYLKEKGVPPSHFNSYGSRRGNDEVMARGTFANLRLKNKLCPQKTGGWTVHFPDGDMCTVWDAAVRYRQENVPLIIIAGKEYGTGSSRDWAAKGTAMLGIRAVLAESFERIHRSNLIGMGVLPLQFTKGESAETLGIRGDEVFTIEGISSHMKPRASIKIRAMDKPKIVEFDVISRLDTPIEVSYYVHGGILPKVLREIADSFESGKNNE